MNKVYPLILMAGALTLGGCRAKKEQNRQLGSGSEQSQGSTQQDTAKVTFSAKLPDGPHAAYIDPKTQIIRVQVRESSVAGYDVAEDSVKQVVREYIQCLYGYGVSPGSSSSVQIAEVVSPSNDCGPVPGSLNFPLVDEGNITPDESAIGFNLRPNKKYRFSAALYASETERRANNPFAWATTFARLEEGNNYVELNLIYGSWTFDNEPQLQLLNRDSTDLGVEGFESGFTWDQQATTAVPAVALGLIDNAGEALGLRAMHIRDYPRFTTGNTDYPFPEAIAFEDSFDYPFSALEGYPLGVAVPHNPLIEFSDQVYLGEGFEDPPEEFEGPSRTEYLKGMYAPATLMQQYDPNQSTGNRNSHVISLGDWEVVKFVETEDDAGLDIKDYFSGLFFYNALDDFLQRLQQQEPTSEGLALEGVEIWGDLPSIQVLPGLTIALLEVNSFDSTFTLAGDTDDFSAIIEAKPSQLNSPSQIETTLIEYVGVANIDEFPETNLTPPTFNEDGSFATAQAVTTTAKRDTKRSQWIRAQIKHQMKMNLVSELLGEAPPMSASSGCYFQNVQREITDSYYQLIDGVWTPGTPEEGYWFVDVEGQPVRDENGDIVTIDESDDPWAYIDENEDADDYRFGIISLNFDNASGEGLQKTEDVHMQVCLQPATLTAGPYRDPRKDSEVDGIIQ
ncbi:hypothetical protein SAMN05660443_1353 [Marinospirillum celere]|uniref:Uncharacterized protein n=1 Tax=Marinospirillum celere TaxID=1122252 RepID=A0A1I1G266_9GAMM|nr:hypothetical protein [Marinospirillum celere]SFC05611.1 hypothetical protein SAMN05660443_1353 [Marinospirillum celere]